MTRKLVSFYDQFMENMDFEDANYRLEPAIEARNILLDKAIRINRNQIFIADKNINEPLLVFSMETDPQVSLDLFKRIKERRGGLLVNRWRIYYLPKVIKFSLPAKNIVKNNNRVYQDLLSKRDEYKITVLTNIPGMVKNESGMIDMSYLLREIENVTTGKGLQMQSYLRAHILESLKRHVESFTNYKNKAIIFRAPLLKGTGVKTSITNSLLLKDFRPVLWFIEWMYNDIDGFKQWLKDNNVSIVFEGAKGQTLVLGRTEASQNIPTFNYKYIIKCLHYLDGNEKEIDIDDVNTDDELMEDKNEREESDTNFTQTPMTDGGDLSDNPPKKIGVIKQSEINKSKKEKIEKGIKTVSSPKLSEVMKVNTPTKDNSKKNEPIMDPKDPSFLNENLPKEELQSMSDFDNDKGDLKEDFDSDVRDIEKEFDNYLIEDDEPEITEEDEVTDEEIADDLSDITESESELPIPGLKKDYFKILEDKKIPEEVKAAEIVEVHNYTALKNSVESKEVAAMRRAMNSHYGYKIDEVVKTMKDHKLKVAEFNIGDKTSSYANSTFDKMEETYAENLKDKDLENILTHPSNLTYPDFLNEYKKKDITDREFKGYNLDIEFITHNGEPLKINLDIPEILENGQLYIGGSKKNITHQDVPKPVIKTDQDVIINTAYNKCFLKLKGKYPGSEMKRVIKTISDFSKQSEFIRVKTTDELGDFIYKNEVSYKLIHLNKHFAGLINKDIDIDFRGMGIVEDEKVIDKLKKLFKHDGPFTILGVKNKIDVYHEPESDKIAYNGKVYDTTTFIANTIKETNPDLWRQVASNKRQTLSGVNSVYCKIMGKELPVIYVLMCAKPLKEILELLKESFNLEYKVIKNDNPALSADKIRDDYGYGIIKMADYSIVLKYNNPVNEILLLPLVERDLTDYDTINITNLMKDLVGNANTQLYIENFVEFFIDPITARVCTYYGMPNDFVGLFIYAASLFTTHKTTYMSDSRNYRLITTQELINRCIYDVIAKELSDNAARMKRGSRPKVTLPRDAVIRRLQLLPNISEGNNLSPHRYIAQTRSKSYKGHFGTNEERAYKNTTRMFNENNMGTETGGMAYSANAGITKYLPFNPITADMSGRYKHADNPKELKGSNIFSFVESYVPYINYDSNPRVIMANAQFSHVLGVAEADPMIVSTYADEAAAYMTPDFSYVAKGDGEIESVNNKFCKIRYKDGTVDVIPLESTDRNSDKGYYTKNDFVMDEKFKVGSKVKANDLIAYNKFFYKKKADGAVGVAVGPLVHCLVCDSDGVWEDSTLLSNKLSNKLRTYVVKRIARVMDLNSEIREYITQIGKDVKPNDILFKYKGLSDDAALSAFFGAMAEELSLKEVEAHYKGRIVDIKLYYRRGTANISNSIKKFIRDISDIQRVSQNMKDLDNVTDEFKKQTYSSAPTELTRGKFSKINGDTIENGQLLVEYYIEIEDKLGPADKLVVSRALKQEPTQILDDNQMPVGILSGRKCDLIFDTYSCLARMTAGMILEGTLNLILMHDAIKNRMLLNMPPEKGSILDYKSSMDMVEGKLKYNK